MRLAPPVVAAALAVAAACSSGSSHTATTPEPETPAAPAEATPAAPAPAAPAAPKPMSLADTGIVPAWLDRNADPCQDFFKYACGGFLATAVIPPDRSSWSAITVVTEDNQAFLRKTLEDAAANPGGDPAKQKIGDYYAACMNEEAIEAAGTKPLQPLLDVIAKVTDAKSAGAAVMELHASGVFPFFALWPHQDFADATQVIATLDQAGLGLPDRDYYLKSDGNRKQIRAIYKEHLGRMFGLLGLPAKEVKAAVADVLRIENALAKVQQDNVTRRDPHAVYHRIDRKGLEQRARGFAWGDYLAHLGIPDVTAISVHDPAYYGAVVALLGREKPAALRHYLTWNLISAEAPRLSKAWVDEEFTMDKALTGVKELPPRWRRCVERTDNDLGELLGQPYVAARFPGTSKSTAIDMTKAVLGAMNAQLDALPWMDAATRTAAREKLTRMAYLVGYPDKWRVYDFAIARGDHAGNVLAATRFEIRRQMAKIGKPVDRGEWQMTPPTVNAYYEPTLNEIALPAGQLQAPFFGASFHPAVNFGSTGGGTIGHEMTHGFDDEGSQFDATGNLRDWWSKSTKDQFGAATQCVVDQYAQYEAVPGVKLNGKLTAGENIADIGGVKLGYQAYQAWRAQQAVKPPAQVDGFTDDQLYFLAYGQSWCAKVTPEAEETRAHTNPHSPPRWRVNGVIVDQPGFGPAFQCKVGTPMNPDKKCAVW